MERYEYKKCFFPSCNNDSNNTSKAIVRIREDLREKWCREANVEYFKVYTQYCCEDHFDPKEDLINCYYKSENKEPRFKPTAKLRNIAVNLIDKDDSVSQPQETELSKLLMQPTNAQAKKRKYGAIDMPSTSGIIPSASFKIHAGVQATTTMVDKSSNTSLTTKYHRSPVAAQNIYSSQESSSTPVSESLSLYTCPSGSSDTSEIFPKNNFNSRLLNLEKINQKPKMYLGIPKQYDWLIDFIVQKSPLKIDSLCVIATLLKIKQNDTIERMSDELDISRTKLSAMIFTGVEALACFFQNFIFSPDAKAIKCNLPLVFKIRYSNVHMIIDCFEIQICKPSDPLKQAQTWSQYKHCNTVKYLIGCTPNGFISFISEGYGGRISDKALVEKSNFIGALQPNAVVLADRGFKEIECELNSRGMKLLKPPSVYSGVKLTTAETLQGKVVASLRVHVERVIRRIREFAILKPHSVVNYKYVPYLDEMVIIACGLINLQGEIIKSD